MSIGIASLLRAGFRQQFVDELSEVVAAEVLRAVRRWKVLMRESIQTAGDYSQSDTNATLPNFRGWKAFHRALKQSTGPEFGSQTQQPECFVGPFSERRGFRLLVACNAPMMCEFHIPPASARPSPWPVETRA